MTTTQHDTPPTHVEVRGDIEEVITDSMFYHMMNRDPLWTHSNTFMGDVTWDTSEVPQWKVEEHDIRYTTVAHHTTRRTLYVLTWRDHTWA